jgi:hypothetical protein
LRIGHQVGLKIAASNSGRFLANQAAAAAATKRALPTALPPPLPPPRRAFQQPRLALFTATLQKISFKH